MTKADIMKLAHKLAKAMVGDYQARLSLALRQAWTQARKVELSLEDRTELIANALRADGMTVKIDYDCDFEGVAERACINVGEQLSRRWRHMGYIVLWADSEPELHMEYRAAGIRNIVTRAIA